MYINVSLHSYVNIYVYIYKYIHTHTYIYTYILLAGGTRAPTSPHGNIKPLILERPGRVLPRPIQHCKVIGRQISLQGEENVMAADFISEHS